MPSFPAGLSLNDLQALSWPDTEVILEPKGLSVWVPPSHFCKKQISTTCVHPFGVPPSHSLIKLHIQLKKKLLNYPSTWVLPVHLGRSFSHSTPNCKTRRFHFTTSNKTQLKLTVPMETDTDYQPTDTSYILEKKLKLLLSAQYCSVYCLCVGHREIPIPRSLRIDPMGTTQWPGPSDTWFLSVVWIGRFPSFFFDTE